MLFEHIKAESTVLFHNNSSPGGEQPEHRKLAREHDNNQVPIVQQYFTNIAAIPNVVVLQQIWLYEIIVGYWCVKLPQCGYMKHGLKHITFYVQKHIAALAMCYNPVFVFDKPLGAPASVNCRHFVNHHIDGLVQDCTVSPLLTHCRYCSRALSRRYVYRTRTVINTTTHHPHPHIPTHTPTPTLWVPTLWGSRVQWRARPAVTRTHWTAA